MGAGLWLGCGLLLLLLGFGGLGEEVAVCERVLVGGWCGAGKNIMVQPHHLYLRTHDQKRYL